MNNNEEYQNLIELLKKALEFYANPDNYNNSLIQKDGGYQAKFALDKIEEVYKNNQKILDEYISMSNTSNGIDDFDILNDDDIINKIKAIDNINNNLIK